MCSTPFGIRGKNTRLQRQWRRNTLRVLNAFRHQREKHRREKLHHCCRVYVLNAFRHQREKHARTSSQYPSCCSVLNAFRHQREKHFRRASASVSVIWCSTPFGIRGKNTRMMDTIKINRVEQCSTPFGIRGKNTVTRLRSTRPVYVLNAFRHQREKHPASDSRHKLQVLGAQRLSASEGKTREVYRQIDRRTFVLNAFRHQREKHLLLWAMQGRNSTCSTPFGIRGKNTFSIKPSASTHTMCSTPFGIRGKNTIPQARLFSHRERAQRLSASEGKTPMTSYDGRRRSIVLNAFRHQREKHRRTIEVNPALRPVLNAFRHQREKHAPPHSWCRRSSACAQRLSASEGKTRGVCARDVDATVQVLNAFRHQREKHPLQPANVSVPILCSTPFGIRGKNTLILQAVILKSVQVLNAFRHQMEGTRAITRMG